MRTSDADILIIPGIGDSSPDHWQSRWEGRLSTARRVHQQDWGRPTLESWSSRVAEEVAAATRPVILVAHSFGVLASVEAAPLFDGKVVGAFLVAPPSERMIKDMIAADIPGVDPESFSVPRARLLIASVVVASRDDVFSTYEEAEDVAAAWGSSLADAGAAGHINADSGHGPWPEGLLRFTAFIQSL